MPCPGSYPITTSDRAWGETGTPFIPFTRNASPGGDHKYAEQSKLIRIVVIASHGKTVVIYLDAAGACNGCGAGPGSEQQYLLQEFIRFVDPELATPRFAG